MRKTLPFLAVTLWFSLNINAQDGALPYQSIPEYPDNYNAETVAARMIDGLGYRYYWATEGLTVADLQYRPGETSRSSLETIQHIHSLSFTILNATLNKPNEGSLSNDMLDFKTLREETLNNFLKASTVLKDSDPGAMEDLKIIFKRGENLSEFPFWNMLNGPIADAIWHAGQVVAFRRASGNPINPNVSVFTGKNRNG